MKSKIFLKTAISFLLFLTITSLSWSQATRTSAASGNWSNTATWVGGVVPVAGDNVVIASGHTVTLTAAVDITTGNLTVSGTIALAGFNLTAGSLSGAGNIGSASGTPLVTVGSNGSNTTYSGIFSGTGARLTKEGTGTLTLSGANSYTGATTINAGTLQLEVASERISNSSALVIASGATFDMNGRTETVASLAGAGTVTSSTTGAITLSVGGDNSSTTFSGIIQNGTATSIALTKTGTGTLTLTGANTYTGTTTISAGTLSIGNGGTSGSIVGNIANGASLIFNRSDNLTYAGVISGTGTLTKQGAGVLSLNKANTMSGTTTISNGTLSFGDGVANFGSIAGSIVNNSNLTINLNVGNALSNAVSGTGTLSIIGTGRTDVSGILTYTGSTLIANGILRLFGSERLPNTSALTINSGATLDLSNFSETVGSIAGAGTITSNGSGALTLSVGGDNSSTTFSGIIQNGTATSIALTKTGTGTLTLTGANTYTGTTTISAGTLSIGNGGTSGAIVGNIANSASLIFNRSDNLTYAGVISGTGTLTKQGAGVFTLTGANTYTGVTTISAGTLSIGDGGTTGSIAGASIVNNVTLIFNRSNALTYSGVISGSGTLTKAGTGTLTLSGANTYTGATTISAGTLQLGTASERISNSSALTVNAGATFDLNGFSESVTSLAGAGTVTSSVPGAVTFALVGNAFSTFSGIIQNGNGIVALTKAVAGTITLTGANTYTGITTISGGTLSIGNGTTAGSIASATINNNSNLTFNLPAGTYAYSGIISGAGGVTKSGTGTLTLSGSNTYAGTTSITAGTLIAGSTTALGTGSLVSVSSGATFRTDAGLNLGTLSIAGVMNCNGNNSTCQSLVLGGTVQISNGTYGSTASGATNQDNTRFTSGSTGWVTLTTSPMTITVTTTAANPTVGLPLYGTVNVRVEWGDGNNNTYTTASDRNYTYATPGNYTISIYGVLTVFGSGLNYTNRNQITGVTSWGSTGLVSLQQAFELSTNLTQLPSTLPSTVSNLSYTFRNTSFNQNISSWNTANVKNMAGMFQGNTAFNQPIGSWNTGNVTTMTDMFRDATAFNQNIGGWNTSNVTTTQGMFFGATAFNQDISAWNIRNVTIMFNMFFSAGLSYCNYDALLLSWAAQTPRQSSVQFHGGNSKYTSAATAARAALTGAGSSWTITDGGLVTPVGVASSTQTRCINTALTPITHTTNGFSGIGTPTGLPTGVTANWSSNTITISGTPTSSGTFNYSIPLTGGCTSANATGIITVNPLNTAGVASSTPSVCLNSTLTPITHSTTVATGIGTPSGLPNGVSANWAGNTITISGAPTSTGTFNYSIPLTGGCGTVSASGSIIVSENNSAGIASASPSLCPNNTLIPITHTTTGATSIGTATGLPSGVSASWSNNIITISGTPTSPGIYNYSIPLNGGCGNLNATGSITLFSNCYDWVSTSSTNWNLASNWLQNEVPTENSRIQISATATANLSLDQNRKIESLNLNERGIKVVLGNNNLTINGSIQGENLSSYIRTNSNGSISTTLNNGATKKFPVGQGDYNPVTITNYNTTADSISVRVKDSVLLEAYSGTPVNTVNVQRTWFIKKNNANDSGVDFVFEWDTTQQSGFMPGYYLNHFDGTNWEIADFDNYSQPVKNGSRVTLSMFGYKGGFSPFTFGDSPSSPLPVELLSFTGTCIDDKKLLRWSTASEKDSWFYQVEHSTDGQNWLSGDKIPAAGNSNSLLNYEWLLDNRTDLVYVRLQQHDLDGAFTTYGPIVVNCENENSFGLFPNPTRDAVNVVFSSQQEGNSFFVEVQDLAGKKVYETQFLGVSGSNLQRINTDFAPGIYTVSLWESGRLMGRKQLLIQ